MKPDFSVSPQQAQGTYRAVPYALKREMRSTLYVEFFRYSLRFCTKATVVIRPDLHQNEICRSVLRSLEPFRVELSGGGAWPGGQLFDMRAELIRFLFNEYSLGVILANSKKLYDWQQPILPEDLCLFRPDGRDWMVSMAHDHLAYLILTREEKQGLFGTVPRMAQLLE